MAFSPGHCGRAFKRFCPKELVRLKILDSPSFPRALTQGSVYKYLLTPDGRTVVKSLSCCTQAWQVTSSSCVARDFSTFHSDPCIHLGPPGDLSSLWGLLMGAGHLEILIGWVRDTFQVSTQPHLWHQNPSLSHQKGFKYGAGVKFGMLERFCILMVMILSQGIYK